MPIGYANFGTIEQANNQTVNQLAGLGQQISNAIETHAATQSAQAMLPMLQQQYQTGMSKIAAGDPNGLGDVYSASIVASQNPLLAPMANHAVSMAQSANINAQHMMRTQAMIQGRNLGLAAKYPGFMDLQSGQINPNYTPQSKQPAPVTGSTLANQTGKFRNAISTAYNNQKVGLEDFVSGKDSDAASSFATAVNYYQAVQKDLPGFTDPNFENALKAQRAIQSGRDPALVMKKLKTMTSQPSKSSVPAPNPAVTPQSGMGMIPAASGGVAQADQEEPDTSKEDQSIS
jgi:hypothetical protein